MIYGANRVAGARGGASPLLAAMLEAKRRSGLTQGAIAGRIGMPQSNVSRVEHGTSVSSGGFEAYIAACGFDFDITLRPSEATLERSGA